MKKRFSASLRMVILLAVIAPSPLILSTSGASAQSRQAYCHQRAQRFSGYERRPGNVARGVIGGAIGGRVISGILGGDKRDRRKAGNIAGALGGIGAISRNNNRSARAYRLEFNACMRGR